MPERQTALSLLNDNNALQLLFMVEPLARHAMWCGYDAEQAKELTKSLFADAVDEILQINSFEPDLESDCQALITGFNIHFGLAFSSIGKNDDQHRKACLCCYVSARHWLKDQPRPSAYDEQATWWDAAQEFIASNFEIMVEAGGYDEEVCRAKLLGLIDSEIDSIM